MKKYQNVKVAIRLRDHDNSKTTFNMARSTIGISNPKSLILTDDATKESKEFSFDSCTSSTGPLEICLVKLELNKLLSNLFKGISVGVITLGTGSDKPGKHQQTLKEVLELFSTCHQRHEKDHSDFEVKLSYGIYGITDSSCIDLSDYSRLQATEVLQLVQKWTELNPVDSISQICSSIEQGYSLPSVVLVRIFSKSKSDASLPAAMSTLILADLGTSQPGVGGQLEKSFAEFKKDVSNYDEQGSEQQNGPNGNGYLNAFLDDLWGGSMMTVVISDVFKNGVTRSLASQLDFLTGLNRIKNKPVANLESAEMLELGALIETHGKLEAQNRKTMKELLGMQKALKVIELEHCQLISEREICQVGSERQKLEYEFEICKVAMEKVNIREQIRQREIELICMEHERSMLRIEMDIKQRNLAEIEKRLQTALEEKVKVEEKHEKEITTLSEKLDSTQEKFKSTEKEKENLRNELNSESNKVLSLQKRIEEIQNGFDIKHVESIKEQTAELKKLQAQLFQSKTSESELAGKLKALESNANNFQDSISQLEAKLLEMKMENSSLHAKVEFLSRKPQSPQISKTIKNIESKWEADRESMKNAMEEFRKIITEKTTEKSKEVLHKSPIKAKKTLSKLSKLSNSDNESPAKAEKPALRTTMATAAKLKDLQDSFIKAKKPITKLAGSDDESPFEEEEKPALKAKSTAINLKALQKHPVKTKKVKAKLPKDYGSNDDESPFEEEEQLTPKTKPTFFKQNIPLKRLHDNSKITSKAKINTASIAKTDLKKCSFFIAEEPKTSDQSKIEAKVTPITPPPKKARKTQASKLPNSKNNLFAVDDRKTLPNMKNDIVIPPVVNPVEVRVKAPNKRSIIETKTDNMDHHESDLENDLPEANNAIMTTKATAKGTVKLPKTQKKNNLPDKTLFNDTKQKDEEIEIPGTPQKSKPSVTINEDKKVWKPSSFVSSAQPTIAATSSARVLGGLSLSDFNFGNSSGAGTRIKLPDRNSGKNSLTETDEERLSRRSMDSAIYSTILKSFDLPNAKK